MRVLVSEVILYTLNRGFTARAVAPVWGLGFTLNPPRIQSLGFEVEGLEFGDRPSFFFFFITLGLEMSDTKVYEPYGPSIQQRQRRTHLDLFTGFRV